MTPTRSTAQQRRLEELACVHPNAAGLDIGSEEIVVAVPPIAMLRLCVCIEPLR
jgi:hypothetical protein